MGKKIPFSSTLQITMDSRRTGVTGILPYDSNMLYLPLPDESKDIVVSDSLDEDKIMIVPAKKKQPRRNN